MTSRSRRKRLIILPLVLITVSAGPQDRALAGPQDRAVTGAKDRSHAGPIEPPRRLSIEGAPGTRQVDNAFRRVRGQGDHVLQTQAAIPENIQLKRGSGVPEDDDAYYFKVETEPPPYDKIFNVGSEQYVLRKLERDFHARDPNQYFLLPAPEDRFDSVEGPTLGPSWFQNRQTGRGKDEPSERQGEMRIARGMGEFPTGSPPEAAINNETVGTPDMIVSVDIQLGRSQSAFGIVFRALDPNTWTDRVDQIKVNSFYYAILTGDSVTLGKSVAGVRTVLKTARIPEKLNVNLSITAAGEDIRVLRDDEEVLFVKEKGLDGEFIGLYGQSAIGSPVRFSNFMSMRYGGPYKPREFAQSLRIIPGANVHHFPLYFEQVALERYGHHVGNLAQPLWSIAMFYLDLGFLPYSAAKSFPWECHSNEGYCKPGDIVLPMRVYFPPCDWRGITFQTAITALFFSLVP